MPDVSVLEVLLHGAPVGTITRVAGDRTLFAFHEAYIADPNRRMLSLGFKDTFGALITAFQPTQTRVLRHRRAGAASRRSGRDRKSPRRPR